MKIRIAARVKEKERETKQYSIYEIARSICDSFNAEECESKCPASLYCRAGHNGMIDWLRKVLQHE